MARAERKKKLTKVDITSAWDEMQKSQTRNERNAWRDHFAMAALTGLLAGWQNATDSAPAGVMAEEAYDCADAMLAERDRRNAREAP